MKKLAILSTHPIQYNAPFFRLLAQSGKIRLRVFYTWDRSQHPFDPGFGRDIHWDIDLLDGYESSFVKNSSSDPGSHHFRGIINPSLIAELEAWKPDVLLVYGWAFRSHLQALRHFKGIIPVWFRGDSTLLDHPVQSVRTLFRNPRAFPSWLSFRLRTCALSFIFRKVDTAFYTGSANKKYYLHHGLREDQLVFMPHAVDNAFFSDNHTEKEIAAKDWRNALDIPPGAFAILFAGKLEKKKDPFLLLHAFLELESELQDSSLHLIIVGSGSLEKEMIKEVKDHPHIHFLSFRNQSLMPLVYRLGDLFCLPSAGPGETWGLAVNEALACGRPVLVSDRTGCAADLVKTRLTGEIFTSGDQTELKEKILFILKNRAQYSSSGMQKYISDYSYVHGVKAIEAMI
ncbi:MAG: glycosyltransferase family 4 protein [Bacteroidales bacterium]